MTLESPKKIIRSWKTLAIGALIALIVLNVGFVLYKLIFDPTSAASSAFNNLAEERAAITINPEYLLFLKDDTPPYRKRLFASVPGIDFVAESLFPSVVVVRIRDSIAQTLQLLRQQEGIRLVIKYSPSFGCH